MLSGMSTSVFSRSELDIDPKNQISFLTDLMKLHDNTLESYLHLMSGILCAQALIHMQVLGLFCMICRIPENILYKMAEISMLTKVKKSKSWFVYVCHICVMNDLSSISIIAPQFQSF